MDPFRHTDPFRHLLVATDFSETASWAVAAADGLARSFEARLSLLTVVQPYRPIALAKASLRDADVEGPMIQEAEERLREQKAQLPGISVDTHAFVDLSAAEVICTFAEQEGVDLVVVGTRGLGGFRRLLLGSVAEQVVRHAPCSVLTVGRRAFSEAPLANGIVVATDLSEGAKAAIDTAAMLARAFQSHVTVAHVFDPDQPHPDPRNVAEAFGDPEAVEAETFKRLEETVKRHLPERGRAELLHGADPALTLSDYATQHHPELLVVATHGRTGLSRVLLGSVAERAVRHAPCPVLTVRR
jgi:nucleotide-binding universal stress UspA family protein